MLIKGNKYRRKQKVTDEKQKNYFTHAFYRAHNLVSQEAQILSLSR